jgi:ArsR family transcriptional regulator
LTVEQSFDYSGIMETLAVTAALGALAHEVRLEMFRSLVQAGPPGLAAGVLAERFGLPGATASFHLSTLTQAGLITSRREGRSIIYSANYRVMRGLTTYLEQNCCEGAPTPCPPESGCANP